MGEAVDKLVALAGVTKVSAHKRVTKSGNVVNVDAYTRSLRMMSSAELKAEMNTTDRTKKAQVTNELRRRLSGGRQESKAQITNPSTAPTADGQRAMEKKTDAELKIFAADKGIRAADRKFAEDELKRRGLGSGGSEPNRRGVTADQDKALAASRKFLIEEMERDRAVLERSGINPDTNEAFQAKYGDVAPPKSTPPKSTPPKSLPYSRRGVTADQDKAVAASLKYLYEDMDRDRAYLEKRGINPDTNEAFLAKYKDAMEKRAASGTPPKSPAPDTRTDADKAVEAILSRQGKKPKGVMINDVAYELRISTAKAKAMLERSSNVEKRGTKWWPKGA